MCFVIPVARLEGSSSDYGIAKAMKETTLMMLQENGTAFAAQEKENKVCAAGAPGRVLLVVLACSAGAPGGVLLVVLACSAGPT